MTSTTLTIDQLRLSSLNVRTNTADQTATSALEASILAEGLLQALSVHPMRGNAKVWGVFAGGRRYRSIRTLVDQGKLANDYAIPVVIHDAPDAEIVARSLAENMLRRDLRSYEECAAIARENKLGHTPEQIAERHGQEIGWVRRLVRLGNLAVPVFDAFAAGRISEEQAKAYGATEDHVLQAAAFKAIDGRPEHTRKPADIRAWLRIDDAEEAKLLRFIGADAYRAAGGGYELDLFADEADERGRVADVPVLRRLADIKVNELRAAARHWTGRPELRFVPQPPHGAYGGPEYVLSITPEVDGDDRAVLPDGDVVACIQIQPSGEADTSFWWATRKAMEDATRPARAARPERQRTSSPATLRVGAAIGHQYDGDARQKADALIKEEAGLTQEGTQILRSLRRAILRAALVQDAREGRVLARDYLVWAQLRILLPTTGSHGAREAEVGMKGVGRGEADIDAAREQINAGQAGKTWQQAVRDLQAQSFATEPNLAAAFLDFRNAPEKMRDLSAAVVAGIALERSLDADAYRVPVHDAVAVQARVATDRAIRHWWTPTTAFLSLLPRAERLAIAEPFVERAIFSTWQRLKADELTPHILKVFTGAATSLRKTMQVAAAQWVHPLLRFRTDAGVAAAEQLEAAE